MLRQAHERRRLGYGGRTAPHAARKLHTTDWQRDPLLSAEDSAFPEPGDASSSAAGLARYHAAAVVVDEERTTKLAMLKPDGQIDWKAVRKREAFWLKHGRKPILMFGMNTVSR